MNALIAACAALAGYLMGSISFSRIVSRLIAPQVDITDTEIPLPGTDATARVLPVSSTTVSLHLGGKVGCGVALLDMLKVALPTLAFRLLYPLHPYELIVAVAGMVGHNWPIFHRFRGGRGISAHYGGLLAIDWLGALATSAVGMLLGLVVLRDMLVAYLAGLWLLIPWVWFRTHRLEYLAYAIVVNVLFMLAMIPDLRQHLRLRREGRIDQSMVMQAMPMGRGMLRIMAWMRSLGKRKHLDS